MIQILAVTNTSEIEILKDLIAYISIQSITVECEFHVMGSVSELKQYIAETEWNDVLLFDAAQNEIIEAVINARKKYPDLIIIPIADESLPPSIYVQPDIMPYGLLWRPISHNSCKVLIERALSDAVLHSAPKNASKNNVVFTAKTKTTMYQIPYGSIYYFESKNKRISLRTENREIEFYHTLSRLEEEVPPYFFRCHHSYLVNLNYVLAVDWTTMSVQLRSRITLPVSRHYRAMLKEKLYGAGSQ